MRYRPPRNKWGADFAEDYEKNLEDIERDITGVQEQFNQVVIEGDSSVEAAQARVDAKNVAQPTLKARLDKDYNEVTAQLAETADNYTTVTSLLNDVNRNSVNLVDKSTWQTTSAPDLSLSVTSGVAVFTKLTSNSALFKAALLGEVKVGKKYRLILTAKTTDTSLLKNFWLVNGANSTVGETKNFKLTTQYSTGFYDFTATGSGAVSLVSSSSKMATNEVLSISDVALYELAFEPSKVVGVELLKGNYSMYSLNLLNFASDTSFNVLNDGSIEMVKRSSSSSGHVAFELDRELTRGKYEIVLIGKTSENTSSPKSVFFLNANSTAVGETTVTFTTEYTEISKIIDVTGTTDKRLRFTMSSFFAGETVLLSKISLKKINEVQTTVVNPAGDIGQYRNSKAQVKKQVISKPEFKKIQNNPVFARNDASWLVSNNYKIYFPCVINAVDLLGPDAIDNFYMYYSSDHASGEGGIGLATAPTPEGPFTDRGRIYADTVSGSQTETPWVVWNPEANLFYMYYHNVFYNATYRTQATCLATSPDGVTFTRHASSPVLKVPDNDEFSGDGHTGYARVYRIAEEWVCYHLMGGGGLPKFGISYSDDGITWQTDPRPLMYGVDYTKSNTRRLEPIQTVLFDFRGRLWSVQVTSPFNSGTDSGSRKIYVSPCDDLRLPSKMHLAIDTGAAGSWDDETVHWASILEYNNKLYMYYTGNGSDDNGAIGLAIAEV